MNLYHQLYQSKPSKNSSLELFIDNIEKKLFNPDNLRKTLNNLRKEEKLALNNVKSWEGKVVRVQDKGLKFVVLNTKNYEDKVEQQINRSSFDKSNSDPSSEFKQKVIDWIEKWSDKINES